MINWNDHKKRRYRCTLLLTAGVLSAALLVLGYVVIRDSVPDEIQITTESPGAIEEAFSNPLVTWDGAIPASQGQSFTIECRLLDTVFLKNVNVEVVEEKWVQVSGNAVGIYMETEGILIVDTEEIQGADGLYYDPAENLVQPGDYITAFNQHPISTKSDLVRAVETCNGESVSLSLLRDGEPIELSLSPVRCSEDDYKLGIWVRDDTQGIGTLTYVEDDGSFGALGHGISDVDTGSLLHIRDGQLYETEILGVHRGTKGTPGEMSGLIRYEDDRIFGTITDNSDLGVFGHLEDTGDLNLVSLELGHKQELELGPASILCAVDGQVEEYEVEITKIDMNHQDTNKSFVIQVTDPRLLEKTGGIVQGMSGSPVIQNGKFMGAVTHVFVQDSTGGYGIFAETMLDGNV